MKLDTNQLPDDYVLSPKQIAQIANKPLPTIYRWLQEHEPAHPIRIKGRLRFGYRWADVREWLELHNDKKRARGLGVYSSTTYLLGKRVMALQETDNAKYLFILDLLDEQDE